MIPNKIQTILILIFSSLMVSLSHAEDYTYVPTQGCYLPDGCRWLPQTNYLNYQVFLVCESLDSKFDMKKFNASTGLCWLNVDSASYSFVFKHHDHGYILGNEFELFQMAKYSELDRTLSLSITNLKGFRVDLALSIEYYVVHLVIWDSRFEFYDQNERLIRTCEQYDLLSPSEKRNFILSR